jgi:hypothetical protein
MESYSRKKLLKDILPKPTKEDKLTIRYIVVGNETHQTLEFASQIPLFQMIGKNVGIKNAKAEFVLCTNVDLLFSDELIKFLSKKILDRNTYYRANRCDIPRSIDENYQLRIK